LSTWLLYQSAVYGLGIQQQIAAQSKEEFTKSALETILFTSVTRQPGIPLEESTEIDYLLAALKEDYADDETLDETTPVLFQNVSGIMQPLTPNSDYIFFIFLMDKQQFIAVLLHANNRLFSCTPASRQALNEFLLTTSNPDTSNSRIQLIKSHGSAQESSVPTQISLVTWIATPVDQPTLDSLKCGAISNA
jgi:hypothetical protein